MNIHDLAALGISISIDDFGTGYSSFSKLRDLPVSQIKIDKSFVDHITTDDQQASLCQAIISMGHALNFTVVAEGVETQEQATFLKAYGCDQIQGYLYSKPLEPLAFRAFTGRLISG